MRLVFITPTDLSRPHGGRAMLARLHRDALADLLGADLSTHRLDRHGPALRLAGLRGYIDGVTSAGVCATTDVVDRHGAQAVWLDGSNLGRLAQALRRSRPALRIFTFCHNVEARFFLGALRQSRQPHAAAVLLGNYVAERLAARHSDDLIALSRRDSDQLFRIYGRAAEHLLPMAISDHRDAGAPTGVADARAPLLFVGGSFYPNRTGIAWFAQHVVPRIATPLLVVGHGMEEMRGELEAVGDVRVVGSVLTLKSVYEGAKAVIAPIFDGSGMKTKVAEALMFGKYVVGTSEAFSGYADDIKIANACCATADDFVAAIEAIGDWPPPLFDPAMRRFYERDHSAAALIRRLRKIISSPG